MYKIWCSKGQGTWRGPRFRYYKDALRYADEHRSEFSSAIESPSGGIVHMASRNVCFSEESVLQWSSEVGARTFH